MPSSEDDSPQVIGRSGSSASEGAEFLLLPVGARAVGMGGAVTGMRGAGDLVLWNPSGVASLTDVQLLFNHSETAFDTRSDVISLLWPIEKFATLGVTYYLVDYGDLPSTGVDGAVRGSINFRNQEFLVTMAGRLVAGLEFGVNYKLIQLVFRCDGQCVDSESFTRSTHAVDLGLIYDRPAGIPLSVGASLRHLGFALKGASEHDPLPTRVRFGLAYHVLSAFTQNEALKLALAVDIEDQMRGLGDPDVMIGSEFGVAELFYLRAGYAFLETGLGGPSLGLGVTYDWFYLDLSRGFDEVATATGDEAVQVTFGVLF
ncbi:MAG: PorV/PorQ family protein [Gemmatimonadales bacterium]